MRNRKIRVAYIRNVQNTFTDIDEKLLNEKYDVASLYIRSRHPDYIKQTWQSVYHADLVVAWFASWHSLPAFVFAALLNKPRLLITGGYDVANEPEIEYGLRQGGLPYLISDGVFRLSTRALAFSETAYQEALNNTPLSPQKTQVLMLGVPDDFQMIESAKEAIAITIGGIEKVSVKRKGIREFVLSAQDLPDVNFVVVGKFYDDTIDELRAIASANVEFTGFLSDADLARRLTSASVYVQASYHEGFGLSLAQAMLARCIPLVSRRGSLPEVVGDCGLYVEKIEPASIASKIHEAIDLQSQLGDQARHRILERFSIENRAKGLYNAIDQLVG